MRPGNLFFLYTHGVTEAEDPAARQFGEERLPVCSAKGAIGPVGPVDRRGRGGGARVCAGQCQFDDITCLALRR